MRLRDKANLFHELAQLLRSGISFPAALERLASVCRSGEMRATLLRIRATLDRGATIPEAFASQKNVCGELETGIFTACERSGRMDQGLRHLSEYYAAAALARSQIWRKAAYPIFLLHFGVLTFALPALVAKGDTKQFLMDTVGRFAILWGVFFLVVFLLRTLLRAAAHSSLIDGLICAIPPFGKVRRAFALSRFFGSYEMQLDAGVNVLNSLAAAGHASGSARIRHAVDRALPQVRNGAKAGASLAPSGVFPDDAMRSMMVGEETGRLDEELRRLTSQHHEAATKRMETIVEWMPKVVFISIAVYLGWKIVEMYKGYAQQIDDISKW